MKPTNYDINNHGTATCTICGKQFETGNARTAKYCPDCKPAVQREQGKVQYYRRINARILKEAEHATD